MTHRGIDHRLADEEVCAALREAGVDVSPSQLTIEERDNCCLVRLPDERLAWFPTNRRGHECLELERRILQLLGERCSFQIPRVLFESRRGWDMRTLVAGDTDPFALYERVLGEDALAGRIGCQIGTILAEQHSRVVHADVEGWLPTRLSWPEPCDWIRQRLPEVIDDARLLATIDGVLDAYLAVDVASEDHVLVHGDLGLHNMAVDPETSDVNGVFDYDEACWADRHHDFRYLVFPSRGEPLLEAALSVYEPATGHTLSRERIRLYNAACAIGFLAFRHGVPPDRVHCGRTLAQDVDWVRCAIASL
jgi:Phosphotransferase enzyme family